jgi:hypothetical protein
MINLGTVAVKMTTGKTMNINERVFGDKCPLCGGGARTDSSLQGHRLPTFPIATKCERCGEFSITWEALTKLDRLRASVAISGIAREWTEMKQPLEINKDNLGSLINLAPKTL